jgi:predicted transglutaminase-like protease
MLDYPFASCYIRHAIIMNCADECDISFVSPLIVIGFLWNAANVSLYCSLAFFVKYGHSFLLALMVPAASVFLVHKLPSSLGLVYQLSR